MLKRLSYILLMFYFLGVATGGFNAWLQYKASAECVTTDCEDETLSRTNLSLEEDVICHDIWFYPLVLHPTDSRRHFSSVTNCLDITLSTVAPPPEVA